MYIQRNDLNVMIKQWLLIWKLLKISSSTLFIPSMTCMCMLNDMFPLFKQRLQNVETSFHAQFNSNLWNYFWSFCRLVSQQSLETWQNYHGVKFSIFVSVLPYKKLSVVNHGFPIIALIIRLKLIEYSVHTSFTFRFGSFS